MTITAEQLDQWENLVYRWVPLTLPDQTILIAEARRVAELEQQLITLTAERDSLRAKLISEYEGT